MKHYFDILDVFVVTWIVAPKPPSYTSQTIEYPFTVEHNNEVRYVQNAEDHSFVPFNPSVPDDEHKSGNIHHVY